MTNDLNGVITAAKSFIQSHLVSLNTPTINAGVTPSLDLWGKCYFLNPPSHIPNIAANAVGYIVYWKSKGANTCWGGACYASGTNGEPTSSIPSDKSYFFKNGSWDGVMCHGTEITIHEMHHMYEAALAKRGYPTVKSKATHVYGKTVPHMDYMSAFGFGSMDDLNFTVWAYEQITGTMLSQISTTVGIAIYNGETTPPPPGPPAGKITKAGIISEIGKRGAINTGQITTSPGRGKWYHISGVLGYVTSARTISISNLNARNPPTKTTDIRLVENRTNVNELEKAWVIARLDELPYGAAPPPPPGPPTPPPPGPPAGKITKAGIISEIGKRGAINTGQISTSLGREKWYRFRGRLNYDAAGLNMAISLLNTNARNPPTKTTDISLSENRRSVNELDRTWVQGALANLPYGAAPPPPPPPPPEKKKVTFDSTPAGASVSITSI